MNANNRTEFLQLLARESYFERELTLASGRASNFYIDCKRTLYLPRGAHLAGELMLDLVMAEGVTQIGQQRLALAGDLESARTAHEQRHAEALLERLHLVADGGLGDVQFLGGVGEACVTGGRFEGTQGIQRQLRAAHLRHPFI